MAFLLHLIGMGMGLCTLVAYACIKVGAESERDDLSWRVDGSFRKQPDRIPYPVQDGSECEASGHRRLALALIVRLLY